MVCASKWFIVVFAVAVALRAQLAVAQTAKSTLDWQPALEDAKRVAGQSNRLVLVHFWSPACQACQALEQDVFSQPHVQQQIHAKFVPFKVNAEDYPLTAKHFGIDRVPMDLVIDSKGSILGSMSCPATADAYLQSLTAAASGPNPATQSSSIAAAPLPAAPQPTPTANPAPYQPTPIAPPAGVVVQPSTDAGGTVAQTSPTPQTPPQQPAIPAYSDDRYAEFHKRWGASQPTTAAQPTAPPASAAIVQAPTASAPPTASASPTWGAAGYFNSQTAAPSGSSPTGVTPPVAAAASMPAFPAVPPGAAPLGLEGFCPVTLAEAHRWQVGDRRWGAIHRGRTYLFGGPMEQKQFLANPDRYSPAISGQDVVAALDHGQAVEGQRQFGLTYQNRMYLFASAANQQAFMQNRDRYAAEVLQAENPNRGTTLR